MLLDHLLTEQQQIFILSIEPLTKLQPIAFLVFCPKFSSVVNSLLRVVCEFTTKKNFEQNP